MASAAAFDEQDLIARFEKWFTARLNDGEEDAASDELVMISNYISSSLAEEDTPEEDKRENIRPFIQELNQNEKFNEDEMLDEIINSWSQLKLSSENQPAEKKPTSSSDSNPTETILNMINKHKTQVVASRKPASSHEEEQNTGAPVILTASVVYKSDDEEDETKVKEDGLFKNTNTQEALSRDKQLREKLSEAHAKQKEQAKKALQEQREREADRKKKAQQKAAKVERKR